MTEFTQTTVHTQQSLASRTKHKVMKKYWVYIFINESFASVLQSTKCHFGRDGVIYTVGLENPSSIAQFEFYHISHAGLLAPLLDNMDIEFSNTESNYRRDSFSLQTYPEHHITIKLPMASFWDLTYM